MALNNCHDILRKMEEEDPVGITTSSFEETNFTYDVDPNLMERYLTNKKIDEPAYSALISFYCILIAFGALGNILVVSNCFPFR